MTTRLASSRRFPSGLYGVTPHWQGPDQLESAVRAAAAGGMTVLQFRHKSPDTDERESLARHLLGVCHSLQIPLIVNDDWRLAQRIGAHGVHLGKDDDDPAMVRAALDPDCLLGVSCYDDLNRARQMLETGVDYVAFGAMFTSGTKPHAPGAALQTLTEARALVQTTAPQTAVVAIGGITVDNAASVLAAGADSLAVVGGLFLAPDIEATARSFSALLTRPEQAKPKNDHFKAGDSHD